MKTKKAMFLGVIILLMVSFMLPLGCAEEEVAPTPIPTQFKTYSKYGFSFQYPKDFLVAELGVLENEANDNSGMVIVGAETEELEIFQVSWVKTLRFDLEGAMEGGFQGLAKDMASVERGELVESTKAGHRMLYQYYTATDPELGKWYGILAGFYCDKSEKGFGLITASSTISAKQDVLENFQNYLDSFVCH